MDLNKFTERSQAALMEARANSARNQHQAVDVEHLALDELHTITVDFKKGQLTFEPVPLRKGSNEQGI